MTRVALRIAIAPILLLPIASHAQDDEQCAQQSFQEAAVLCERDGGRLWGISLCGPMVFADPVTRSIATNQPAPGAPRPATLGYANMAGPWGGDQWSMFSWPIIPADDANRRGRMLI